MLIIGRKLVFVQYHLFTEYHLPAMYYIHKNKTEAYNRFGFLAGLWIRIHFLRIRIRIQWIRMEANTDPDTDPDPDPIRIQGFNDQKLKKNNS